MGFRKALKIWEEFLCSQSSDSYEIWGTVTIAQGI